LEAVTSGKVGTHGITEGASCGAAGTRGSNAPFSATFTAVGGTAPYTWTTAELPPGLAINASTGTVSGTATDLSPGNYSLITVRDSENPAQQVTMHYIFNVRLP
jgi:hypothetical protein